MRSTTQSRGSSKHHKIRDFYSLGYCQLLFTLSMMIYGNLKTAYLDTDHLKYRLVRLWLFVREILIDWSREGLHALNFIAI